MRLLLMKLMINGLITVPFLVIFAGTSFSGAVVTSVLLSVIAYVVGDRFILKVTNNVVATVADLGLAFVFFVLVSGVTMGELSLVELLTLVAGIGVLEYYFHRTFKANLVTSAA
ncbi:hypothetical protein PM3016_6898 [Paenibacillus mucilaginosus 3016]|uniref:DUF2512 family protein n=2 Tax=Paenibacillus mucilaginosus TaxID=61624 RepID=H6NQM7_9BACL|nr:DUF2512 family protein [Paenibacillus mucilaginosus]AFC33495.1 hypothetical protein PM3016_6898 [Paenibacillus mucilaginosus 3016]AFH65815.1 hypothetical protein B2K_34800 [Paenibacillus mucilaginosus K02]WFA21900.1 DUF2512 family protein [Paenibacillus mucilaginosus]